MVVKSVPAAQYCFVPFRLTTQNLRFCFITIIILISMVIVILLSTWSPFNTVVPSVYTYQGNLTVSSVKDLIELLIRNSTSFATPRIALEYTTDAAGATSSSNTAIATTYASVTTTVTNIATTSALRAVLNNITTTIPMEDCGTNYYKSRVWPNPGPPYQCVSVPGRLGNAMFVYASSFGVASLNNRTMVVNTDNELLQHFKLKALVNCGNKLCNDIKGKYESRGCCIFSPELLELEPQSTAELRVGVYLQSWRYFNHSQTELRRQFTPYGSTADKVTSTVTRIKQEIRNISREDVTYVGIHVRHGDITRQQHFIDHGYLPATLGYYKRAMTWFVDRFPKVVFLISSDDEDFTKSNIMANCNGSWPTQHAHNASFELLRKFGMSKNDTVPRPTERSIIENVKETENKSSVNNSNSVGGQEENNGSRQEQSASIQAVCRYVSTDQPAVDMLVLASCDHVIMSTGTYGWWVSWLSGGTVIYFNHPVRKDSALATQTNLSDHIPPHWLPME